MELLEASVSEADIRSDEDFIALYERAFLTVATFVRKMNGSYEEARDIYHDALVIFQENQLDQNFALHRPPEAYILGIVKHLWMRKYNRDRHYVQLHASESDIKLPDDYFPSVDHERLLRFLERSGKKCMDLLRAFYYEHASLTAIARRFGYSNEHSVSAQKYKCIEKIRNTIKEKSASYEDFIE